MRVQVKLFSTLREALPREARGTADLELAQEATVEELLTVLGIHDRVKLVTVNGERETDPRRCLAEGDMVYVFPPVVGG